MPSEMDDLLCSVFVLLLFDITFHTNLVFELQRAGQGDAQSTTEVVGMKREMDMLSLLVW